MPTCDCLVSKRTRLAKRHIIIMIFRCRWWSIFYDSKHVSSVHDGLSVVSQRLWKTLKGTFG